MKIKSDKQKIIHLTKTNSTNEDAWEYYARFGLEQQTVIWADYQTQGRGMSGNKWSSESGKNLTFSLIIHQNMGLRDHFFLLNQIVALALYDTVEYLGVQNLQLKWPNDLYMDGKKIAGVLIENRWANEQIQASVIGVGINVNQKEFEFERAGSIYQQVRIEKNIEEVLHIFLEKWDDWFIAFQVKKMDKIRDSYCKNLMFYQKFHLYFIHKSQDYQNLKIVDVGSDGLLVLIDEKKNVKKYQFKEISPML